MAVIDDYGSYACVGIAVSFGASYSMEFMCLTCIQLCINSVE